MATGNDKPLISLDQPSELALEEYNDLLQQIQNELTIADCHVELLDAARYNDLDVLRALLKCHPNIYTHAEEGNTALHMAAANGHVDAVQLLLQCGADASRTNQAGNTPLHWAAANGHQNVVDLILQQDQKVDVLQQNAFGRSVLTEGFSSQNTDVVKSLLQHETASEERLMQSTTAAGSGNNDSVTHEFVFGRCNGDKDTIQLHVRELAIAKNDQDSILGQVDPADDTTGLGIWAASLVCAQWMAQQRERFTNRTVLELGAGCGVPGICISQCNQAKKVYLTDFNPKTAENLQYNVEQNECQTNTETMIMNWQDESTWPSEKLDYVIGSDLIYQHDMVPLLVQTLKGLLKATGVFLYVAPATGRQGHDDFLAVMEPHFTIVDKDASTDLLANPLASQDDDLCFLHFHELQSINYKLYEFQWKQS